MRTAIYLRVSTRDKGQETENQSRQLRAFCESMKHEIVAEYIDKKTATGKVSRESFQAMLADANKRKFDLVLFWSLDRFCREGVLRTLNYLEMLTQYGVAYKSFTEQYLDSCGIFKDAVVSILATVAKQESIRLGERVRAGMERAKAQGVSFGKRPLAARKGIDPAQVRQWHEAGQSYRAIARRLAISPASALRIARQDPGSVSSAYLDWVERQKARALRRSAFRA